MFYLRINKVKIFNNRELFGKAEIQFMSFVTNGESDFPMLEDFFNTNDADVKKELIKQAISKVLSSRIIMPIQKFKDNQEVFFGDTGFILHKSETIPKDLNWMFLAVELDSPSRDNAALIGSILTDENISTVTNSITTLAGIANPIATAITQLSTFVAGAVTQVFKNNKDDQAGLFLTSFIEKIHYPNGKREKEDARDLTDNMLVDYTIFAF